MALTTTTLSAALTAGSPLAALTAAPSTTGNVFLVDGEFMSQGGLAASNLQPVIRGTNQTTASAHPSGANVVYSNVLTDFASPPPGSGSAYVGPFAPVVKSYSAAGAIDLPAGKSVMFAVINGAAALAMTVAAPGADQDGAVLVVSGNGAAQHTVQFTGGLSGAGSSYDVITFNATVKPDTIAVYAVNGFWQISVAPALTGTVTSITGALS